MARRERILVLGFMGACPISGVVWQHIHYIVGLIRLGYEVYYIEDTARLTYNPETFNGGDQFDHAVKTIDRIARLHGFSDRWAFRSRLFDDMPTAGPCAGQISDLYKSADAILNVCGSHELHEELEDANNLIYVESDPGVEQVKIDNGQRKHLDMLLHHKACFTFGELVPTPGFPVPVHGVDWKPTRQPVVTDFWYTSESPSEEACFTTIANWSTSGTKDVEWRDDTYLWSKSLEFQKFVEAPTRIPFPVEMVTEITDEDAKAEFLENGWRLVLPFDLSADFDAYRDYIASSLGEFTAAKDQYVRLNTGWFSDRSACYLAAGRPVITQETGFSKLYGGDRGLFGFSTLDDIGKAADAIASDYQGHCDAAAEIAREYFEAEKVLAKLLDEAGV